MRRVLFGLAYAAGVPVTGLALVLSGTALVAFGPPAFDGWVGTVLAGLLTIVGFGGVLFSQLRYESGLVFLGAFFPLMLGLYLIDSAVEDQVLLERGEVTTCTVLDVTRREQSTEDGTRVWYEHDLDCARPEVTAMTTGSQVGQEGDQIEVRLDPAGRLDPRPAGSTLNPGRDAALGAVALSVAVVLRLLGESTVSPSGRFRSLRRRDREWRKEQRRIRKLDRARSRGDLQTRVGWLLPTHYGRPDRDRPPVEVTYVYPSTDNAGSAWVVKPVRARRCQVSLRAAPPAVEEQIRTLCDLYLTSDRRRESENVVAGADERVAADHGDLRRWHEAADRYLSELAAVNTDLWRYWVDRGRRLGVSWGRSAPLRAWQDHVRSGYERLVGAADAYRPVLEEISAAIATTTRARQDLEARDRRLQDWQERPLWYLRPTAEGGVTIVRSDVSGQPPPDAITRTLRAGYTAAKAQQDRQLIPVDWDEASLRACDAELAAMSAAYPPVGETRSGRSMTMPSPATFADWFRQTFGVSLERISDRDELQRRRQLRDWAQARGAVRPRPAGGSWPTDPGSGDYGGSGHGGGDYGGGGYSVGGY